MKAIGQRWVFDQLPRYKKWLEGGTILLRILSSFFLGAFIIASLSTAALAVSVGNLTWSDNTLIMEIVLSNEYKNFSSLEVEYKAYNESTRKENENRNIGSQTKAVKISGESGFALLEYRPSTREPQILQVTLRKDGWISACQNFYYIDTSSLSETALNKLVVKLHILVNVKGQQVTPEREVFNAVSCFDEGVIGYRVEGCNLGNIFEEGESLKYRYSFGNLSNISGAFNFRYRILAHNDELLISREYNFNLNSGQAVDGIIEERVELTGYLPLEITLQYADRILVRHTFPGGIVKKIPFTNEQIGINAEFEDRSTHSPLTLSKQMALMKKWE